MTTTAARTLRRGQVSIQEEGRLLGDILGGFGGD